MKTKNIIACLTFLLATQVVSGQNNAETIIRLLVNQVKSHKNVEMQFSYQISPDEKTVIEGQKGKAWLQDEAFKIELADQQILSDGKTIWTYFIDAEEVMVSNASEGTDNTPLKLLTSLDESYVASISGIDANGIATIELANPKGQYRRVTMKIDTKKTELKSTDIYMEDGSKIVVNVEKMIFDQKLDDNCFTFDTKTHPDVEVIDMR